MSDSTVATPNQDISEQEYKNLCKKVRHYQLKHSKKRKAPGILKPMGEVVEITKKFSLQKNAVDWDDLPTGAPFALDTNCTVMYTKAGKNKALCINTMTSKSVAGAVVYRIYP
jgi:hypothetical protein